MVFGDMNAKTGMLSDEPLSCVGIDKYIDSLSGDELSETPVYDIGRRFSLDKKSDSLQVLDC